MGHFAIPAWNSLITDLIDPDQRGAYFGHRARLMTVTSFFALCGAGLVLHAAEAWEKPWAGFVIIFLLAAAARGVSTSYLARIDESTESVTREAEFRLLAFLRRGRGSEFFPVLVFFRLMHGRALIAGPYFLGFFLPRLPFHNLANTAWVSPRLLRPLLPLQALC